MPTDTLDELDFGILHLLQQDARNTTTTEMEELLPVTDTTIRNRIESMEQQGIIEGYGPKINYGNAGFPMRVKFICTTPVENRLEVAKEALELSNVVHVEEMLSARENVRILVVTNDAEQLNEITSRISALDLTIERESLLRHIHSRPFNHFGTDIITKE